MTQRPIPISLLIVCDAETSGEPEAILQTLSPKTAESGGSVFAFDLTSKAATLPGIEYISDEQIGRGLFRRLAFFADREDLPYLVAPFLLRHLWARTGASAFVIAYPGSCAERLAVAYEMIEGGCDAILLRRDDETAIVTAMARTKINKRVVLHWADRIEQSSMDSAEPSGFDRHIGGEIVSYVCDRVGSIRDLYPPTSRGKQASPIFEALPNGTRITPFLRNTVRKLLPEVDELLEDPFQNALEALNAPCTRVQQDPGSLITRMMFLLWSARVDLQSAFDLSTGEGRSAFVEWFLTRGPIEVDMGDEFFALIRSERQTPSNAANSLQSAFSRGLHNQAAVDSSKGVNLVGYARAEMGMGEQLRLTASALSTTNVQFGVVNFSFGIIASQRDRRCDHLIRTDNPFDINLFHINADQMHLALEKLGPAFFRDHYNIGYWEWELSSFPQEWLTAIDIVDEIWAPSTFIQQAISGKTAKPVIWMPLAVEFPKPRSRDRRKFGLPEDAFLFLFCFDFSSFATRKNFLGCIEAFRKAFPSNGEKVGLVIKTIRHPHHKREFWDLLRAIGADERIHLIDRVLPRAEIHELTASCDSFISLHRSEGFGLGLAEAMYLGKPVIATNYSGNTDFTREGNSCLVNYRLVCVKSGDYVFAEGQSWAEPDIHEAAMHMRHLVEVPEYGRRLGEAAAHFIRQQHSCAAVGRRYAERLKQIANARALLASPTAGKRTEREPENADTSLRTVVKKILSRSQASG